MVLPVYDPKSFESIDLRKYHVRDIRDAIKFLEFTVSRMEEAKFILKKFNTQFAMFQTVSKQLQKKQEEQQMSYGNPEATIKTEDKEEIIQKVDASAEKEKEALLDDIRQAVANEEYDAELTNDRIQDGAEERKQAIVDKYKAIDGKYRVMYFRDDGQGFKMVSAKDVPNDIKDTLLKDLGKSE